MFLFAINQKDTTNKTIFTSDQVFPFLMNSSEFEPGTMRGVPSLTKITGRSQRYPEDVTI
jgi:hypothetical protein